MSFIEFYYHSVNVLVQYQDSLSYIQESKPAGILIDMWKLIMLVMNNKDTLFIDSNFNYSKQLNQSQEHEIILNFYQTYDYQVSQSYLENSFDYNRSIYEMSAIIVSENYLFVFLDNFWPVALKIIYQIFIYIGFLIVPWIIINLNFIAFFIIDVGEKPYYFKIRAALQEFIGYNKQEKSNMCKSIYKIVFVMITFLILVILFTDFIYLIINQLAKSNLTTTQDMKDYNAQACYYIQDQFLTNMFERDRGLSYKVGESQLECLILLEEQQVDVVIISEFNLLIVLEKYQSFLNKLRYQVQLNTNIAHYILISKEQPQWFRNELKIAIDIIQRQKLDLLVKEKHLPTKLYNSKNNSIMPNQPTFQFICASLSVVFVIIIQLTLVYKECIRFKYGKIYKNINWKLVEKIKMQ